jgi:hypothetical protein
MTKWLSRTVTNCSHEIAARTRAACLDERMIIPKHRHVDLRLGSLERVQRRLRKRRSPDARRLLHAVARREA